MLRSSDPHFHRRRAASKPRILLFSATRDWHARALTSALKRRGTDVTVMRLESIEFDTTASTGMRLPRLDALPDGALVRTLSSGSFEAVTRRLGVLHALSALGVPAWNTAVAIERCVDKSMTTFLLAQAGLPVPPTWTVEGIEGARRIAKEECREGPLVLKPLFGSQGRGLRLISRMEDLPDEDETAGVYYLQRFIAGEGPGFSDFRVLVIDGRAIAAMARHAPTWITNVKQGGRPATISLTAEFADLACAAAAAAGASFCGVDLLRGTDGRIYVLEINSMPAWSGLQSVSKIDIAGALADAFCRRLRMPAKREPIPA
jgi:RimK family alpha-L-glutamate ligase